MKPTKKKIKVHLKRLRKIIENDTDRTEARIAQAVEFGIRWASESTVGWENPETEAHKLADVLREEL